MANQEICIVGAIMISEVIKIDVDHEAEMEEVNLVVELSMDKIKVDQGMFKITGMIIGE